MLGARALIVTLVTDASFCPSTRAAGWAAWAKSDRGFVKKCGIISKPLGNNNEAEFCAIANGLFIALQSTVCMPGDLVILQTDSHFAYHRLSGKKWAQAVSSKKVQPVHDSAKSVFQEMIKRHNLRLEVRQIKGHTAHHTREPHDHVMSWADKASRSRMSEMRREIRSFVTASV